MPRFRKMLSSAFKRPLGITLKHSPWIRNAVSSGLTVFAFHEVSDNPSEFCRQYGLSVSRETFIRQITWIESNFQIIHPSDIIDKIALPDNPAAISFDDGFLGTFETGLPILRKLGLPSIVFLNMQAILNRKPILSATASYLERYVGAFADFGKSIGLSEPAHLMLTPAILEMFERQYGPIENDLVLDYQGAFVDLQMLEHWDDQSTVVYGNHLFEHWNAPVLNLDELAEQYDKNERALSRLKNHISLFAFTNGAYSSRDIDFLRLVGAGRAFSTLGGVNRDRNAFLLGRISLSYCDVDDAHFWFQLGRAIFENRLSGKKVAPEI